MQILYLITARGGSKGVPGKNIRILGEKPLIAYSIEAAKKSIYKGTVVVSTDDDEIAAVAKKYGAEVPFRRPAELATDSASSMDAIMHALDFFSKQNKKFDIVVLLQPTSPLRTSKHIDEAMKLMQSKKADAIVSVCEAEHHPLWSNTLPENGSMKFFLRDDIKGLNRQQLPKYYRLNGTMFISNTESLIKHKSFFHDKTYAYQMSNESSVDIDHEIDFKLAELILSSQ